MLRPGDARRRMEETLNAAYGEGLLSQRTLSHRLQVLFGSELVDPSGLIGDLTLRAWQRAMTLLRRAFGEPPRAPAPPLLALDWSGEREDLLVGRHAGCDVVLPDPSVSRRHAWLTFSDGQWIVRDLDSTNGTCVNDRRVERCALAPGDRLRLGSAELLVD